MEYKKNKKTIFIDYTRHTEIAEFFEGVEDKIQKYCPHILPLYEDKKIPLCLFAFELWERCAGKASWMINESTFGKKRIGKFYISVGKGGMDIQRLDSGYNGVFMGICSNEGICTVSGFMMKGRYHGIITYEYDDGRKKRVMYKQGKIYTPDYGKPFLTQFDWLI